MSSTFVTEYGLWCIDHCNALLRLTIEKPSGAMVAGPKTIGTDCWWSFWKTRKMNHRSGLVVHALQAQFKFHSTALGALVCSALTLVSHNKLCRRAKKQRSMGRTALVLRLGWDGSSLSEHSVIITYTSTLIVIVITCFIFPLNINIWLHTRMVGHGSPSVPYEATRWLPKATDLL